MNEIYYEHSREPFPEEVFTEQQKDELFETTAALADKVEELRVKNIIFIDVAARPAATALREYWRLSRPDREMPKMYFVNPLGFKTPYDLAIEIALAEIFEDEGYEGREYLKNISLAKGRDIETIEKEFEEKYKRLMSVKDEPLLVFDTCIHSGQTAMPVVESLRRMGFNNLFLGTALKTGYWFKDQSGVFYLTEKEEHGKDHLPFGLDKSVVKRFGSVESSMGNTQEARALRKEIKKIIRERFQK